MKKNIFVIGDLVIDHTVFVTEQHHASEPGKVYNVVRRQDAAGGAANTARIVAMLNDGSTYLWGLLGESRWGTYRTILESSQLLDGAPTSIELRGVRDETDAPMTTINRLVLAKSDGRFERGQIRYDDAGHVHVSAHKRTSLLYHLDQVQQKHPLDAIVINDLDRKCLNPETVLEVSRFAVANNVPLFVDPKRDRTKYSQKHFVGTVILPNLDEWCHLVDAGPEKFWRDGLENPSVLAKMALRSFRYLPKFTYYIITCDTDGAVIIAPQPQKRHLYAVYRMEKGTALDQKIDSPLGCGDIVTGAFALEYDRRREEAEGTEFVLSAISGANAVVGCYCDMPWHRMPPRALIEERLDSAAAPRPHRVVDVSSGMRYMPEATNLVLATYESEIPRFYTDDEKTRECAINIMRWLTTDQSNRTVKSAILGAPSGTGKSVLLSGLATALTRSTIPFKKCEKERFKELARGSSADLQTWLRQPDGVMPAVVLVDEAYGSYFSSRQFFDLVMWSHDEGVRFVFVDSQFREDHIETLDILIDTRTRCQEFQIPSVMARAGDIPLMVASKCMSLAEEDGAASIKIEQDALRLATDSILKAQHTRDTLDGMRGVYGAARRRNGSTGPVAIGIDDFTPPIRAGIVDPSVYRVTYTVSRDH